MEENVLCESFADSSFWNVLEHSERVRLAHNFLEKIPHLIKKGEESEVFKFCAIAEMIASKAAEIVFQVALHFYHFGVLKNEKRLFLMANMKLVNLEKEEPSFFEKNSFAYHLWGNVLTALGSHTHDVSFFEEAIAKYRRGLINNTDGKMEVELYWDLGETLTLLGKQTKEACDFKEAIRAYEKGAFCGASLPHFWIDFGETLFFYGLQIGAPSSILEAIEFFKKVVVQGTPIEASLTSSIGSAYNRAWFLYALASKCLVEVTGDEKYFVEADKVFKMALTYIPEEGTLWLLWAEMALRFGYLKKDLFLIDLGLDKLSSEKAYEANQTAHNSLLAEGILYLGILLDNLRWIKEGEKRLKNLPNFLYGLGLKDFALGIYYQDATFLEVALKKWEELTKVDPETLFFRYMLFESQMSLFEITGESKWCHKALKTVSSLIELRPHFAYLYYDWGICLLKLHECERSHPFSLELAIQKFAKGMESQVYDMRGLFHYAIALDKQGVIMHDSQLFKKAIAILEDSLEKFPPSLPLYLQLGITYLHLGALQNACEAVESAIDFFELVLEQNKEEDQAWLCLGQALLLLSEMQGDSNLKERGMLALTAAGKWGNREVASLLEMFEDKNG